MEVPSLGLELASGVNSHGERSSKGEDGVSCANAGIEVIATATNASIVGHPNSRLITECILISLACKRREVERNSLLRHRCTLSARRTNWSKRI